MMRVYSIFMDIFYLSPKQGAATTLFAALSPLHHENNSDGDDGRRSCKKVDCDVVNGGKWCSTQDLPYIVPYNMPFQALGFEMVGFFDGPQYGAVSLPQKPMEVSKSLWDFSENVSKEILGAGLTFE